APHLCHLSVHVAVSFANLGDLSDIRMGELRGGAGFANQASAGYRVSGERVGQHLESDVALEPGIEGAVDVTHPPRAEWRDNPVATERRACGQHGRLRVAVNDERKRFVTRRALLGPAGPRLSLGDVSPGTEL